MLVTLYSSKPIAIFSRPQIVIRILKLPDFQVGTFECLQRTCSISRRRSPPSKVISAIFISRQIAKFCDVWNLWIVENSNTMTNDIVKLDSSNLNWLDHKLWMMSSPNFKYDRPITAGKFFPNYPSLNGVPDEDLQWRLILEQLRNQHTK